MIDPKDRTDEFMEFVKYSLSKTGSYAALNSVPQHSYNPTYNFERHSKVVGSTIFKVKLLLDELKSSCESITLFDDKTEETERMISILRKNVNDLGYSIKNLENILQTEEKQMNSQLIRHYHTIIILLSSQLVKLSGDFRETLKFRARKIKELNERGNMYSSIHNLQEIHNAPIVQCPPDVEDGMQISDEFGSSQQLKVAVQDRRKHTQQRYEEMQSVETTVVELGTMMQQLAMYVKEQEETVQRVETTIDMTNANLEAANRELMKYLKTLNNNRSFLIKMFGVLLIFVILFFMLV